MIQITLEKPDAFSVLCELKIASGRAQDAGERLHELGHAEASKYAFKRSESLNRVAREVEQAINKA